MACHFPGESTNFFDDGDVPAFLIIGQSHRATRRSCVTSICTAEIKHSGGRVDPSPRPHPLQGEGARFGRAARRSPGRTAIVWTTAGWRATAALLLLATVRAPHPGHRARGAHLWGHSSWRNAGGPPIAARAAPKWAGSRGAPGGVVAEPCPRGKTPELSSGSPIGLGRRLRWHANLSRRSRDLSAGRSSGPAAQAGSLALERARAGGGVTCRPEGLISAVQT